MSELKACPFCGAEAHIKYSWLGNECVAIGCGGNKECPAANDEQDEQGGFSCEFDNVADAAKNWNTRPLEDALLARAEAAEKARDQLREAILFGSRDAAERLYLSLVKSHAILPRDEIRDAMGDIIARNIFSRVKSFEEVEG